MKTFHLSRSFFTVLALLVCLTGRLAAQIDMPPMPRGYWEWLRDLHRDESGGGLHADDDAPPFPGSGVYGDGGAGPDPTTNLINPGTNLWLLIQASNQYALVTLSNTVSGSNYLLLSATNLAGPLFTNQSLLATSSVTPAAPLWVSDSNSFFFIGQQGAPPAAGTVRWIVPLVDDAVAPADGVGPGLNASPALGPTGMIYQTLAGGGLLAIDPGLGAIVWSNNLFNPNPTNTYSIQAPEMTGSAAVGSDSNIYAASLDGNLYCFYPDGTTKWVRPAGGLNSCYSTPCIGRNGVIYVASDEAVEGGDSSELTGLAAFNPDGTTNWFFQPQDLFYGNFGDVDGSPVVGADGTIYFISEGCRLYAISAEGHLKWFLPVPARAEPDASPAILPDGSIVVGSTSFYLYDVTPDGALQWVLDFEFVTGAGGIFCEPAIGPAGDIYTGSDTHSVVAINPGGNTNWLFTTAGITDSSPALAADGTMYFGDGGGTFYAVNTNGSLGWSYNGDGAEIFSSPVILSDGSVVMASEDGNLYCFWGTAPPDTNAPWSMFQHDPAHTGQAPPTTFTNTLTDCGAPFVFNGDNDGMGDFFFSMTGVPGSSNWNVYASTNLADTNWTLLATNLTLDAVTGNSYFADSNVAGLSQQFYKVSRSNCCSKAIGFVNLTIAPGTNLIAAPLYQVDDGVLANGGGYPMNTLNSLFNTSNAWGVAQAGTAIYKWNGTGFDGDTNVGIGAVLWAGLGNLTLLPGTGVLMSNANDTPFTIWFNGLVREQQVFHIQPGTNHSSTNYLSATLPVAGAVTDITGYVPHNGDTIQLWNTTSHIFDSYEYNSSAWSPGAPAVGVGEGFVLITTNTYTWTNTWQQCPSP